jgi:hypothetical protein
VGFDLCKYTEPPPSASPTPAPDTLSPTYYTQSPTLSAAPTRSPTPGAAPTAYRVQRHRRATWSSATPVLVLVFGLLFGLMVMYGVRRVVQQKCMADKEVRARATCARECSGWVVRTWAFVKWART